MSIWYYVHFYVHPLKKHPVISQLLSHKNLLIINELVVL